MIAIQFDDHCALYDAALLYRALISGAPLPVRPSPPDAPTGPHEPVHLAALSVHELPRATPQQDFPGAKSLAFATHVVSNMFTTPDQRSFAEWVASADWRSLGSFPTLITGRGIRTHTRTGWLYVPGSDIVQAQPFLARRATVVAMREAPPVRLTGPWATWAAVVLTYLAFGPQYLSRVPEYLPLLQTPPPPPPQLPPPVAPRRVPRRRSVTAYDYDDERRRREDEEDRRREEEEEEEEEDRRRQQEDDDYYDQLRRHDEDEYY